MKFVSLFICFFYGVCADTVSNILIMQEYEGVIAIYAQLGTHDSASTTNNVNAKICDSYNNCCDIQPLSSSTNNIFDVKGKLSTIPGEKLGQCAKTKFKRQNLQLTLTIDGTNGLQMNWIKLRLASGEVQTCQFHGWIDASSEYSPTQSVACQGNNLLCPEVLVIDDKHINDNGESAKDYTGKYAFHGQVNGKPSYRHEANDFYISYENGWEVSKKASFGSASADKILTSHENVKCPLDIRIWNIMGNVVANVEIYGESNVNYMIKNRGHCEKGIGYTGSSIVSMINVKTVAACDVECEFDPRCSYFSLDVTTYTCQLFSVFNIKVEKEFSISGLKGCTKKSVTAGSSLAILEPHMITGLGLAIKSSAGYYWHREHANKYVYFDHQSKSRFTRFLAEKASDDSIYLKGESGKYLTMTEYSDGKIYMKEENLFPSTKSELEVIPRRGKVAFRLKENAKFLKDAGDSEDLIAVSTSLDNEALFTIETGSVREVTERIVDVNFRNTADYSKIQPSVVQSKTIVNKGSKPVEKTMKMSWEETSTQSTTWEHNWAIGVSTSSTVEFDIGFISAALSVSFSADYGGSHTKGNEKTSTINVGEDTKVVVPANKTVKADLMLKKIDNAELFFTAKIVRESDAGVTTFYQDGVWRGVVVINSFVRITEEDATF